MVARMERLKNGFSRQLELVVILHHGQQPKTVFGSEVSLHIHIHGDVKCGRWLAFPLGAGP